MSINFAKKQSFLWIIKRVANFRSKPQLLVDRICHNRREKATKCHGKERPLYNTPHPPKDPPANYHPLCVEHEAFEAPTFLAASAFRKFQSPEEILGPNAHKDCCYKNPEYFAYHRYSFYILQGNALQICKDNKKICK